MARACRRKLLQGVKAEVFGSEFVHGGRADKVPHSKSPSNPKGLLYRSGLVGVVCNPIQAKPYFPVSLHFPTIASRARRYQSRTDERGEGRESAVEMRKELR